MAELLIEHRGRVAVVTLNRPEKRNALNRALIGMLVEAIGAADKDDAIGAIVVCAAGPVFCAGADLAELKAAPAAPEPDSKPHGTALAQNAFCDAGKPVIAAVNGAAVGAGAGLALAADFILMATNARILYPEVRHGIMPSLVAPPLVRAVGRRIAYELLATGDAMDAERARVLGVAYRVVEPSSLVAEAVQLGEQLAALDPALLAGTKRLVQETGSD